MSQDYIYQAAYALYAGGWKSSDLEEMQQEYGLEYADACKICSVILHIEVDDDVLG